MNLNKDGQFLSDKYDWCPPGFFAIKLTDPIGRLCLLTYAELTDQSELARDLRAAIKIIEEKENASSTR